MNQSTQFLGIVEDGKFHVLDPPQPAGESLRFTSMAMQESRTPESAELDLAEYEGRAVLIRGHGDSGWICSAELIDQAKAVRRISKQPHRFEDDRESEEKSDSKIR